MNSKLDGPTLPTKEDIEKIDAKWEENSRKILSIRFK